MYLYPFNSFGFSEIAKTSKILPSSSFKRANLSSGNSSLTAGVSAFTPPSNGFSSIVGTFSSDLDVITSREISSSLSVCVMFPVFSSTVYIVVTFTFFPFFL